MIVLINATLLAQHEGCLGVAAGVAVCILFIHIASQTPLLDSYFLCDGRTLNDLVEYLLHSSIPSDDRLC